MMRFYLVSAPALDGEDVLFHKPLQFCLGEFTAQSVFLDVTGHVHPFDPTLLVVVVVQRLKNFGGLLLVLNGRRRGREEGPHDGIPSLGIFRSGRETAGKQEGRARRQREGESSFHMTLHNVVVLAF